MTAHPDQPPASTRSWYRFERVKAIGLDVRDGSALDAAIAEHDVVVSLVPWQLHPDVARACIKRKVDMVTTSYVSPAMEAMDADAKAAGITILNEIGLDPGIDHLGAMRVSTMLEVVKCSWHDE